MFHDDTVCSHEYYNADGFCEACGAYQEPKNWKGYYEIYNAGQLFWFAKQFNDSKIPDNSNLKLMKDIEIPDGHDWTSIGNITDKFFKGNIEGNYHVISGLRPANDDTSYKRGLVARIQAWECTKYRAGVGRWLDLRVVSYRCMVSIFRIVL